MGKLLCCPCITEVWGCADTSILLQRECVFDVSAFPRQRSVLQTGLRELRLADEMRLRRISGSPCSMCHIFMGIWTRLEKSWVMWAGSSALTHSLFQLCYTACWCRQSWPPRKSTLVIKHRVLRTAEHSLEWLHTATAKLGNNNEKIILHTESESRKSGLDKDSTAPNFHRVSSCSLMRFREMSSPCPPPTSCRTISTPESFLQLFIALL